MGASWAILKASWAVFGPAWGALVFFCFFLFLLFLLFASASHTSRSLVVHPLSCVTGTYASARARLEAPCGKEGETHPCGTPSRRAAHGRDREARRKSQAKLSSEMSAMSNKRHQGSTVWLAQLLERSGAVVWFSSPSPCPSLPPPPPPFLPLPWGWADTTRSISAISCRSRLHRGPLCLVLPSWKTDCVTALNIYHHDS